jgi:hypothetical protein
MGTLPLLSSACKIRHVVTWLAVVVPVASLVAGSVLTMWGQGRADRRALERQRVSEALVSERERQARLDTFAIKRFEFDRETLIELQQILLGLHQTLLGLGKVRVAGLDLDSMRQLNHVRLLESRVMSDEVRLRADHYLKFAEQDLDSDSRYSPDRVIDLQRLYNLTQRAIGDALRVNPLQSPTSDSGTILRSVRTQASDDSNDARSGSESTPIRPSWRGIYNNDFPIELHVREWNVNNFEGEMIYPGRDTVTRVTGRMEPRSRDSATVAVRWEETSYAPSGRRSGRRSIDFNGHYEAAVSGDTMTGQWYQGNRLVATFKMEAIEPTP